MGAKVSLKDALGMLDPKNDYDWTSDGFPRMAAVETLVDDESITRKDVTDADPEFYRHVAQERSQAEADASVETEVEKSPRSEAKAERIESGLQTRHKAQTQVQEVNPEEALRTEIQEVGKAIEELATEQADIVKLSDNLKRHQARLQAKTMRQHSPEADTKARMVFIESQNDLRAKRHEKGRKIMALIGKDGMNPTSRLDQAMRRKTARGTRRPQPRTPNQE